MKTLSKYFCVAEVSLISPVSSESEITSALAYAGPNSVTKSPIRPHPLCDQRLARLRLSHWIDGAISDGLAGAAISLYLETDHPVLGLFDADLFLDDLVTNRPDFCSSLLVCALLCWACVSLIIDMRFTGTDT